MTRSHTIRMGVAGAALAAFAFFTPYRANAQPKAPAGAADQQYADWVATYGHWSTEQAIKAGYLPTDVCVTASAVSLPDSMGSMGRHFVHPAYIEDGKADADAPDIVMFDADDRVVGIEFEILTILDPIPSVGGVPLERTEPHPGVDEEHLSLHVFFVGDEGDRYKSWNPAVDCGTMADPTASESSAPNALPAALPAGLAGAVQAAATATAAAAAAAVMDEASTASAPAVEVAAPAAPVDGVDAAHAPAPTVLDAAVTSADGAPADPEPAPSTAAADAPSSDPANMPVAGAGDWLPGGNGTLLALLAIVLVALAAAGRRSAVRRV